MGKSIIVRGADFSTNSLRRLSTNETLGIATLPTDSHAYEYSWDTSYIYVIEQPVIMKKNIISYLCYGHDVTGLYLRIGTIDSDNIITSYSPVFSPLVFNEITDIPFQYTINAKERLFFSVTEFETGKIVLGYYPTGQTLPVNYTGYEIHSYDVGMKLTNGVPSNYTYGFEFHIA